MSVYMTITFYVIMGSIKIGSNIGTWPEPHSFQPLFIICIKEFNITVNWINTSQHYYLSLLKTLCKHIIPCNQYNVYNYFTTNRYVSVQLLICSHFYEIIIHGAICATNNTTGAFSTSTWRGLKATICRKRCVSCSLRTLLYALKSTIGKNTAFSTTGRTNNTSGRFFI